MRPWKSCEGMNGGTYGGCAEKAGFPPGSQTLSGG